MGIISPLPRQISPCAMGKGKTLTKSALFAKVAEKCGVKTSVVKGVLDDFTTAGYAELKKTGTFKIKGWAKMVVKKTKAKKARKGVNPFTKEPCTFKAKKAGKTVRARALKPVKVFIA